MSSEDFVFGDGVVSAEGVQARPSVGLEISNEMVHLYKTLFGRGPTKARTGFLGDDLILCTLEDTLTPVERSMAAVGDHQRLREMRMYFQYIREQDFRGAIERITGRTVRAFVSGIDTHADVATELFYLDPVESS